MHNSGCSKKALPPCASYTQNRPTENPSDCQMVRQVNRSGEPQPARHRDRPKVLKRVHYGVHSQARAFRKLTMPQKLYIVKQAIVAFAGPRWIHRFSSIAGTCSVFERFWALPNTCRGARYPRYTAKVLGSFQAPSATCCRRCPVG